MKEYRLSQPASMEGLKLHERDTPAPGPFQVLVRVRAASINFKDLMVIGNFFPVKDGLVPFSDAAGEVVAIGEGVTLVKVGDRVATNYMQRWIAGELQPEHMGSDLGGSLDGVLADHVLLGEHGVTRVPDHLSWEEAATLPCAGLTAWSALIAGHALEPGQTVLTLGTGGVSIFVLQFAKLFGARVISTTSSDEKADQLKTLGADAVINYKAMPDWDAEVMKLTDGRGVDRVVEVGGPATFSKSIASVRVGGSVSAVGGVAGFEGSISPFSLMLKVATVNAIVVGSAERFAAMARAIGANAMRPVVAKTIPFENAADAYAELQSARHVGKIVVTGM